MRGAFALKRITGSAVLAAAVAGAAASPATAMIAPACTTRVVAADPGTAGSCSFDTQYDYALISVAPVTGTVEATIRCFTSWGYTYTSSRTVAKTTTWESWSPGSCTLTLTSGAPLTTASGSAAPTLGPIIDPPPGPYPMS